MAQATGFTVLFNSLYASISVLFISW